MTKELFTKCIGLLQSVFGVIDTDKNKVLYSTLETLPDEDFLRAVKTVLRSFSPTAAKPFPLPVDFFEAIGQTVKQEAQYLLSLIQPAIYSIGSYRSVDFGSPALHSVIQRYGGWTEVSDWNQDTWNINEGRFLAALETAILAGEDGGTHLRGILEATNGKLNKPDELKSITRRNGKITISNGHHKNTQLLLPENKDIALNHKLVNGLVSKFTMK